MGFKNLDRQANFAGFILKASIDKSRCLEQLMNIEASIHWQRLESVLMSHYTVGKTGEGADAYSPILLFKCLLLQKWFHINSDPELESQINDRVSFKKFLGLSFSDPSPDHSTFSRPAPLEINIITLQFVESCIGLKNGGTHMLAPLYF